MSIEEKVVEWSTRVFQALHDQVELKETKRIDKPHTPDGSEYQISYDVVNPNKYGAKSASSVFINDNTPDVSDINSVWKWYAFDFEEVEPKRCINDFCLTRMVFSNRVYKSGENLVKHNDLAQPGWIEIGAFVESETEGTSCAIIASSLEMGQVKYFQNDCGLTQDAAFESLGAFVKKMLPETEF